MWNSENVSPQRGRAALRELRRLAARPPPGTKLLLRDDDLTDIVALIEGPAETPYSGGVFRVRLALGREFPAAPPRAYFLTRIFHPNVGRTGEVCVNTLKRDWKPELGLEHALVALRCLLIAPNPDSALNADAAHMLHKHYDEYFTRAKLLTDIHARPRRQDTQDNATNIVGDFDEAPTSASDTQPAGSADDPAASRDPSATHHGDTPATPNGDPPAAHSSDPPATHSGDPPAARDGTSGEGGEGPRVKRERRRDAKPAPARDKRRVLKRL